MSSRRSPVRTPEQVIIGPYSRVPETIEQIDPDLRRGIMNRIRGRYTRATEGVARRTQVDKINIAELHTRQQERSDQMEDERFRLERMLADKDIEPLTGLLRREAWEKKALERFHHMLRSTDNRTVVVLFEDLDHFKKVNDSFGHHKGDEVLSALGFINLEVFQPYHRETKAREENALIARYGGEEVTALLFNTDPRRAQVKAQNLITTVNEYAYPDSVGPNGELTQTILEGRSTQGISIGMSVFELDQAGNEEIWSQQLSTAVKQADKALYEAKNRGRNQLCIYDPNFQQSLPLE